MRPKSEPKQVECELFQSELEQIIDLNHPLVRLGRSLDWARFESALGQPITRRREHQGRRRV